MTFKKLPKEKTMIATAISLRMLLQQMKFSPGAELAVVGYLFGLLLRETPEEARGDVLAEFNDLISKVVDDAD